MGRKKIMKKLIALSLLALVSLHSSSYYPKILQQTVSKKSMKRGPVFEFKYSPSILGDPNSVGFTSVSYQKDDAFIEMLLNFSKPQKEFDSLCETIQIKLIKPDFEVKYNRRSNLGEGNKKILSEWWHVSGQEGTIVDLNGDRIPDIFYKNNGEAMNLSPNCKDHEPYNQFFTKCLENYEEIYAKIGDLEKISF